VSTQETQESLADPRGIFIEDILDTYDPVLLDTNVVLPNDLLSALYDHHFYESINTELLEQELPVQELFLKVLNHKDIVTIPQVTKEFSKLTSKLRSKVEYLDKKSRFYRKLDISKFYKNQGLLETVCQNTEEMYKLLSLSQLVIDDESHSTLVEMVKTAQGILHLKENTHLKYGSENVIKETDTDERLVAAFYWICLNPGTKPAIVSGDWDILRLVGGTYDCFSNPNLFPYNELFKEAISKSKPVVYISDFENVGWNRKFGLEGAIKKARRKYTPNKRRALINRIKYHFISLNTHLKQSA